MVEVNWKVCAAAIGIIVMLAIILIRLHPTLHRIELAVEGLSPPPGDFDKPLLRKTIDKSRIRVARQPQEAKRSKQVDQTRQYDLAEPLKEDTEHITQKASQDSDQDSNDFDL
jgi:hypothetical protein